jgi:hypothetical protein
MKQPSIQIDRQNKTVTIIMPLQKPHPSKSTGKTLVIATTGKLKTSEEVYARQPVCFSANVFFFPKNASETKEHSATSKKSPLSVSTNRSRRHELTDGDSSM